MADLPSTFKIAQILGITGSSFLSGFAFSASYLGIPALALAPTPLRLQQWLKIYDLGKLVSPSLSVASSLAWAYVTYSSYTDTAPERIAAAGMPRWTLYGFAGAATLGVLMFTVAVMMPTNIELMKRAGKGKGEGGVEFEEESKGLLRTWDRMNYVRALLPMVGAVVGLWAAL